METLTLITPTGDRPLAFALCQNWVRKQTLQPDQWIVVDDGKIPIEPYVSMEYMRREPQPSDPQFTLLLNLKTALPLIKGDKIIIIEDDEYYAPKYVATMVTKLDGHEIVGIGNSKYYHLFSGGYFIVNNTTHASFAEMAFRSSFLPEFQKYLSGDLYLDKKIWKNIDRKRGFIFFDDGNPLYVGMKGMPGRHGIGGGHDINHKIYQHNTHDISRNILKQWIPDIDNYNIYMDIVAGKLTGDNYKSWLKI